MSGDVQPRKRKDKKRKKDELGVEEPRGTAAALGEGDVFIHSHHDHGTGGHWCAKIIFFSLLAVLITLIGLIILENRGLTELEANSVESRYSGVLEGWLEDAPEDNHHDEHTLELNHPDDEDEHDDGELNEHDDDDDEDQELDHDQEDEHDSENDEDEDELNHSDNDDENADADQDLEDSDEDNDDDDEDEQDHGSRKYYEDEDNDENYNAHDREEENDADDDREEENDADDDREEENDADDDREQENDDDDDREEENDDGDDREEENEVNKYGQDDVSNEDHQNDSTENDNNEENEMNNENKEGAYYEEENAANEDEEEHEEEDEEDKEVEIERIEREIDLEPISTELPALPEEDDDDDDDKSEELSKEADAEEDDEDDGVAPEDLDDDDFLEDDTDEPPIEHITAHVGKPLVEVEEESSEKPPDTLAEEEEYEKQQEEKKREEEEKSSHMWLKLSVGGALLAATHAVVRRATAPREAPAEEERSEREETPLIDRRMTLIPEEPIPVPRIPSQSYAPPVAKEEFVKKAPVITQSPPSQDEEDEDDEEKEIEDEEIEVVPSVAEDKELYSDEEVEEEEEIQVKKELPKLSAPKPEEKVEDEPEAEDDDVEIIDEEQIDEEVEEEDDEEEEISDVDDAELLSRLEAKYGRLSEPERPGQKHKDGGNSFDDLWPGEPSDSFWRQELDSAEEELRRGSWSSASSRASVQALRSSARARWIVARAHDLKAEAQRDNKQLAVAIAAYLELLKMNDKLPDDKLKQVAERVLDRIMFRGTYLSAEPVYRLLIRRFPEEVSHRNNLTIAFLMANRADLAEEELKETLRKWPNDRVALAHYGFVLKTLRNRLEEAVTAFEKALEGDTGPANEPRFYYHLGDALLLLGKPAEAHEVHKRGAKLGHFLSPAQRSLYNVPRLKSKSWWNVDETPYARLAHALEKNWKEILKEGEAAKALYEKEKEGLKERGDWSQLDLFARGREIPNRCKNAPVTCSVVRSEPAAVGCRRGQIKFSSMAAGTHVRPHVGPTNCRLRMHLALSNTNNTFIRVDQTVRQWEVGKVLMFDDSFEHEVWHNGTGSRLVLIVDVWHPSLTPRERSDLPPI